MFRHHRAGDSTNDLLPRMRARLAPEISREAVSNLAFLNWEKDGCPKGRDLDYWLEAESQLKATWHLFVRELSPQKNHRAATGKAKPRVGVKLFVRPKAA